MEDHGFSDLRHRRGLLMVGAGALSVAALVMALLPKPVITRADAAKAAQASTATSLPPEASLGPGETLVEPRSAQPMMPRYSTPEPPPPAPKTVEGPPAAAATPPIEHPRPKVVHAAHPEPRAPSFARGDAHPTSPLDTWPNPPPAASCATCGEVVVVTVWPDVAEVRVRFEDGRLRTLRSPVPTRWRVGDRVRAEHGRLVRD